MKATPHQPCAKAAWLRRLGTVACGFALWGSVAAGGGGPGPPNKSDSAAVELAPGVYVVAGVHAAWADHGADQVANTGFVIGSHCIAVIDTGGSPAAGRALLAEVRRASALPVCYVINTHVHPDHVLGNLAFVHANGKQAPPQFVGHARLASALAARAPYYLKAYQRDIAAAGDEVLDRIPPPDVAVQGARQLDLGARVLELQAWPTAHTDNDLTVLDRSSGTLWLGDLAFEGHLPVLDGKLVGWLQVLDTLAGLQATRAVPGHGKVFTDWPAALAPTRAYLQALRRDVNAALDDGTSLAQAVERLARAPAGWLLGESFQRRNVTAAYAELEWSR